MSPIVGTDRSTCHLFSPMSPIVNVCLGMSASKYWKCYIIADLSPAHVECIEVDESTSFRSTPLFVNIVVAFNAFNIHSYAEAEKVVPMLNKSLALSNI